MLMNQNDDTLHVLVVEPGMKPYSKEIASGLEALQKEVGGYIEAVYPFDEPVAIVCNEEGKLNGAPFNRTLRDETGSVYDVIAGTFLVVGLGDEDFCSLTPDQVDAFGRKFDAPELFMRMNGKLVVLPLDEERTSVKDELRKHVKPASRPSTNKVKQEER